MNAPEWIGVVAAALVTAVGNFFSTRATVSKAVTAPDGLRDVVLRLEGKVDVTLEDNRRIEEKVDGVQSEVTGLAQHVDRLDERVAWIELPPEERTPQRHRGH